MEEARTLLAAGSSEQAEETLRGAIAAAHERADESAALRRRVELGDLLAATGRESEASGCCGIATPRWPGSPRASGSRCRQTRQGIGQPTDVFER